MHFLINFVGILLVIFIVWWFWFSHQKTVRINNAVISIEVKDGVYIPARIEVPAHQDITLEFLRKDASSCAEYVVFDALNIQAQLPLNKKHLIYLGKLNPGKYTFTCQMKMYRGELMVVKHSLGRA